MYCGVLVLFGLLVVFKMSDKGIRFLWFDHLLDIWNGSNGNKPEHTNLGTLYQISSQTTITLHDQYIWFRKSNKNADKIGASFQRGGGGVFGQSFILLGYCFPNQSVNIYED